MSYTVGLEVYVSNAFFIGANSYILLLTNVLHMRGRSRAHAQVLAACGGIGMAKWNLLAGFLMLIT